MVLWSALDGGRHFNKRLSRVYIRRSLKSDRKENWIQNRKKFAILFLCENEREERKKKDFCANK